MNGTAFKVIRPRKRALPKPIPEKLKPRSVTHRVFGVGELRAIRASESGGYIVECDFGGVSRTIRLAAEYWVTPVKEILKATPHLPPLAPKPEPVPVENDASNATGEDAGDDGKGDEHDASEDGEDDQDSVRDEAETEAA